ncbi:MAG: response regulator transcription factor [Eubacteriales bacterium]|nr:response regulator transcription factor [Eubacteriales bacterium]
MRILLIEDDSSLSNIISKELSRYHYVCHPVKNFNTVLDELTQFDPHLVLMDVNLPCFDGFYWCGEIRKTSRVPVIFISARDSNMDVVMAVSLGGDDYVTKPFSMDVLIAKITALLRRAYDYETGIAERSLGPGIVLDLKQHVIKTPDTTADLSRNEYLILEFMLAHAGEVVSRDDIMRVLWEDERFVDDNTLTVNVNRLRKKLSDNGLDNIIATKKGQGYVLRTKE